jgi:deoxyribose-phosphate aldolase
MNIKPYLDATYLKTAEQDNLTTEAHAALVQEKIQEAIAADFKLIMIRPEWVATAKQMISAAHSQVGIGTVIDFPLGQSTTQQKIDEATQAIQNGADELDFVSNYEAFKAGKIDLVKSEIMACTQLGMEHHKIVKWIIEVDALSPAQIIQFTVLIKNVVIAHFKEDCYANVFVKSSTGFYPAARRVSSADPFLSIVLMVENSFPLPVKAAGGVRSYDDAIALIRLGVKRIGTSAAKQIAEGNAHHLNY